MARIEIEEARDGVADSGGKKSGEIFKDESRTVIELLLLLPLRRHFDRSSIVRHSSGESESSRAQKLKLYTARASAVYTTEMDRTRGFGIFFFFFLIFLF